MMLPHHTLPLLRHHVARNSIHCAYYHHQHPHLSGVSNASDSPHLLQHASEADVPGGSICSVGAPGFLYRPLRSVPSGESDLHQTSMGPVSPVEDSYIGAEVRSRSILSDAAVHQNELSEKEKNSSSGFSEPQHYEEFHRLFPTGVETCSLSPSYVQQQHDYQRDSTPESEIWIRRPLSQHSTHGTQVRCCISSVANTGHK